eukprot:3085329-Amphidinium_carterae.1
MSHIGPDSGRFVTRSYIPYPVPMGLKMRLLIGDRGVQDVSAFLLLAVVLLCFRPLSLSSCCVLA